MKYEIVEVPGAIGQPDTKHVIVAHKDGSTESFPVDESNPRYLQFLEEIA